MSNKKLNTKRMAKIFAKQFANKHKDTNIYRFNDYTKK